MLHLISVAFCPVIRQTEMIWCYY